MLKTRTLLVKFQFQFKSKQIKNSTLANVWFENQIVYSQAVQISNLDNFKDVFRVKKLIKNPRFPSKNTCKNE